MPDPLPAARKRAAAKRNAAVSKRRPKPAQQQALATLLELMSEGASDNVRITAAKTLLDRTLPEKATTMTRKDEQDRLAAINAIKALLDELAAAKSARDRSAAALDSNGTTRSADSAA